MATRQPAAAMPAAAAPAPTTAAAKKRRSPAKKKTIKHSKTLMPEFPGSVVDERGATFYRDAALGQGGFARVYKVLGTDGSAHAFKCISKASLASKKTRAKMLAEMKIHRMLKHPNIVRYDDHFDDQDNIYLKLELCAAGNMNDILKRRGPYTEPEARFFMIQILAGCQYLHISNVIHRDLKLGNIFLDGRMNVKIGDFGLAAVLNFPSERKKTMCGTPNYIAPEILTESGHSFEVDVWAVGVILYTLLVGKPPFQTNDVDGIYENIKNNVYSFPERVQVSPEGKALVRKILAHDPADRPSLIEIMADPWFHAGPIPLSIPVSAIRGEPMDIILPSTQAASLANFARLKRAAGFREDADDELSEEQVVAREGPKKSARDERKEQEKVEEDRGRVTREFNDAIQPDAPWELLLRAGRDPLVRAPTFTSQPVLARPAAASASASALAKQLGALNIGRPAMPAPKDSHGGKFDPYHHDKENVGAVAHAGPVRTAMGPPALPAPSRLLQPTISPEERRLIGQKARLVAGMGTGTVGSAGSESGSSRPASLREPSESETEGRPAVKGHASAPPRSNQRGQTTTTTTTSAPARPSSRRNVSSVDQMIVNLGDALDALDAKRDYSPRGTAADGSPVSIPVQEVSDEDNGTRQSPTNPDTFIISWLDHSEKYGLGYALSDGTVGVHFRDATSMTFNASRSHYDYVSHVRGQGVGARGAAASLALTGAVPATRDQLRRENFAIPAPLPGERVSAVPAGATAPATASASSASAAPQPTSRDMAQKLKIMRFFEAEIMERLYGASNPLAWTDSATTTGMTFVHKWYRCRLAIVFRLSSGLVQFNFYDHVKILLSHDALVVSCIEPPDRTDGVPTMRSWTLPELVAIAHPSRSEREAADAEGALTRTRPNERKLARHVLKKLRYVRDVLQTSVTSSRAASAAKSAASAAKSADAGAAAPPTIDAPAPAFVQGAQSAATRA